MHHQLIRSVTLDCSAPEAFEWHEGEGVVARLTPPWVTCEELRRKGGLEAGATTSMTLKIGPVPVHWHSVHTECVKGRMFADQMVRGPFASFEHTHSFEDKQGRCLLTDDLQYSLPMAPASDLVAGPFVRRDLERMFRYRHIITARDLAFRKATENEPRKTYAISGASGVIGSALVPWLRSQGHRVKTLVRRASVGPDEIAWDPAVGTLDTNGLKGCDVLIHLAGENIGDARWTPEKRQRIIASRELGTALLAREASRLEDGPSIFLSASAVGFYGNRKDEVVTEADSHGDAFISDVCRRWEEAAKEHWTKPGGRLACLRIGVVLTPAGGALARLLPVFKAGFGGTIGSGDQYMSWISMEDVLRSMAHVVATPSISGPVNVTAPAPVTNKQFTKTLGRSLSRFSLTSLPSPLVTCAFGDMGREVLLEGVRAIPHALEDSGYQFIHPTLGEALAEVT